MTERQETPEEEAKRKQREAKGMEDTLARVNRDWSRTGETAPTIAGLPISRELAKMLNIEENRSLEL